jgi:hypothetical protein
LENGEHTDYPKPVDECKSTLASAAENDQVEVMALLIEHEAKVNGSGALVVAV